MIARMIIMWRVAQYQLRVNRSAVLLACLAGLLLSLGRSFELASLAQTVGGRGLSLGDCLAFLIVGSSQPSPDPHAVSAPVMLRIPYAWLLLTLIPLALVAQVGKGGVSGLVASGGRAKHWAGRCAACFLMCCLYWLAALGGCIVFVALGGLDASLETSPWFPDAAGLSRETLPEAPYDAAAPLVSTCALSCALALAQLTISEAVGPRMGFIFSAAILAGSVYSMTPLLLGNFMMAARSTVFVVSHQIVLTEGTLQAGLSPGLGVVVACALAAASVTAGTMAATHKDYRGSVSR